MIAVKMMLDYVERLESKQDLLDGVQNWLIHFFSPDRFQHRPKFGHSLELNTFNDLFSSGDRNLEDEITMDPEHKSLDQPNLD